MVGTPRVVSGEGGVRLGLYKEKEREEAERRKIYEASHTQTWDFRNARLYRSDFAVSTLGTAVFLAFWYFCTIF